MNQTQRKERERKWLRSLYFSPHGRIKSWDCGRNTSLLFPRLPIPIWKQPTSACWLQTIASPSGKRRWLCSGTVWIVSHSFETTHNSRYETVAMNVFSHFVTILLTCRRVNHHIAGRSRGWSRKLQGNLCRQRSLPSGRLVATLQKNPSRSLRLRWSVPGAVTQSF